MKFCPNAALAGARDVFPLALGTTPFAVIFGTLAVAAGLPPAAAVAMSVLVFAGSAQFISLSLIGGGAPLAVIWLTTLVVNLRHALYSATLQPVARDWPLRWRALMAFWLTDETFAVLERRLQTAGERDAWPYFVGAAAFFYGNWLLWTSVGVFAGSRMPGVQALGLDFAMIGTFAAMVAPQLRSLTPVLVALAAGGVALLAQGLPYKLGLVLAALVGVAIGVWRDRRVTAREAA